MSPAAGDSPATGTIRSNHEDRSVEELLRLAHQLIGFWGLDPSVSRVTRAVRDYDRKNRTMPFERFLLGQLDISAAARERVLRELEEMVTERPLGLRKQRKALKPDNWQVVS